VGPSGRVLAVDLGDRRIGVAVSDEARRLARPLGTVTARGPKTDARALRELASGLGVTLLVVGLPMLPSGDEGDAARSLRARGVDLARRLELPVEFVDEAHTSRDAVEVLVEEGASRRGRRERIDETAAVLILEAWLRSGGGAA
jgi:putative Holliday junction resolvase